VGLEDPADLEADLAQALARVASVPRRASVSVAWPAG